MKNKTGAKTRTVAVSGILLALAIATLYFQALFPVANFTVYLISSFYVAAVILEAGSRAGWLFYVASTVLAFAVVPDKAFLVPYALFFGLYGIVKYHMEQLRSRVAEYVLKLLFFNASLAVMVLFFKELILGSIELPGLPELVLLALFEAAFIAYDYCYTLAIEFYRRRIMRG